MKKTNFFRKILTGIITIAIIAVVVILALNNGKTKLYNDSSTTGNTACNLLNGGLFTQADNVIYFANPNDNNKLYKMNANLTKIQKLYNDKVSYINAAGNYIFYTRRNDKLKSTGNALLSLSTTGLFRITKNGTDLGRLYENPTQVACLYGNNIYYQHYDQKRGLELYSTKIDGSESKKLKPEAVAPYSVSNNTIYYSGWNREHQIHSMDIDGGNQRVIYDGNCTSVVKVGDYIYFLDMDKNYNLCRVALDGGTPETVIKNKLATYNITNDGNIIFYQIDDGQKNGIYMYDLNSGTNSLIASGDYNFIHIISDYVFYEKFDGSTAYYYNMANGDTKVFNPSVEKDSK